jgi:hypothetical protein
MSNRMTVRLASCLNLARRSDRRLRAWGEFRREGLDVVRVEAMDAVEFERAGPVMVFENAVVLCRGVSGGIKSGAIFFLIFI